MKTKLSSSVDEYIRGFPAETQKLLQELRSAIKRITPAAEELISYQMPAYKFHGMLVYFAGYKNHIGFYPGASHIETFRQEITIYKWAKGSVQFPLDKPLPIALINKMIRFKMKQNIDKAEMKASIKKTK